MSGFDLKDTINKAKVKKKIVSKLLESGFDDTNSTKTGENSNTKQPATIRDSLASGFSKLGQGITTGAAAYVKGLVSTVTKEKSALDGPTAGTCGGTKRRTRAQNLEFMENGFKDYQGTNKVFCNTATATKLNIGAIEQEEVEGGISENVLNDYLNVQYHVVFSMIPEGKTIEIQEAIPLDVEQKQRDLFIELRRGQAVIMASTGGVFVNDTVVVDVNARNEREGRRNNIFNGIAPPGSGQHLPAGVTGSASEIADQINALRAAPYEPEFEGVDVSDRNYYAIQELVIDNFMAPTSSNPGISSMVSGKMIIAEPGGFRLNDDIKTLGALLGYANVNNGRIMYRLDIAFSGYDPSTGRWEPVINLDTRKGKKRISFITYYVTITKLEAKVTNTGTVYEIDVAPVGASALRSEDFTTDAGSIFSGESNTFGGFLDNMEKNLEKKRSEETKNNVTRPTGITRKYEIIAPEPLRAATFYAASWAVQKSYLKETSGGSLVSGGKDIDLLTVINAAIADLPYTHELFIARTSENDNNQFVRPKTHFTTRFNVIYGVPNAEIADYSNMTIQIIIEPFVSYRKGSYSAKSVGEYTAVESQIRRLKQMESIGAIIRKYDFYNTSSNTEVIDFGINLSSFYTESVDSSQDFPGTKGVGVASSGAQQEQNLHGTNAQKYAEAIQTQVGNELSGIADNDARFETRLGDGSLAPKTAANNGLTPYSILGGGKSIVPDQYSYGGTTSEGAVLAARKNKYMREFKDWLANDQQQIDDLNVRGDPLWLLSPYASADMNRLQQLTAMIKPQTDSIIFINIKAPNQKNYMGPEFYRGTNVKVNPNVMGGFYYVQRVTSTFSGGKFTQQIQGSKLNHLNYVEDAISFEDIIGSSLSDKTESGGLTAGGSQISPNANKPPPKIFDTGGSEDVLTILIDKGTATAADFVGDKFKTRGKGSQ